MPNNAIPYGNQFADESATLGEKLSDSADQVKDKVSGYGRQAADTLNSNRDAAASGLQRAASALHDKASSLPGGESVTGLARATAEGRHAEAKRLLQFGLLPTITFLVSQVPELGDALLGILEFSL